VHKFVVLQAELQCVIRHRGASSSVKSARDVRYQSRIGKVLSAYDDLIENNRRRMALLEEAGRQLYREWFVRLRFPGHEHTRTINGVPEGWERRPLVSLCVADGGIQTGPFGSQLHQSDYSEEGVPVIMPKDLVGYRIAVESIARIPEDLANKLDRHRMTEGTPHTAEGATLDAEPSLVAGKKAGSAVLAA